MLNHKSAVIPPDRVEILKGFNRLMVSKLINKESGDWVICCQGTTQLLTAAAAMYANASAQGITLKPEKIVVLVFDLACPESRLTVFRKAIKELALTNYGWFRFEVLDKNTSGFGSQISMPSIKSDSVEAVFSCRNHNKNDRDIMNHFRSATHFCYGDSVGIYTPPDYLNAPIVGSAIIATGLSSAINNLLVRCGVKATPPEVETGVVTYQAGYFSLPDAGGSRPKFPALNTDIGVMLDGYRALAKRLRDIVLAVKIVPKVIGTPLTVLLTSTQSEWGRMTSEYEVDAYVDFVAKQCSPGPIVIKPHPRENQEKTIELVSKLSNRGWQVFNLACNDLLATMPVESQLLTLKEIFGITVLATSSAAYGVALICGIKPVVGFGQDSVRKYFKLEYQSMRIEHEKLLTRFAKKYFALHHSL